VQSTITQVNRSLTVPSSVPARPKVDVSLFAEESANQWNSFVRTHPDGTLFHTIAWRDAVVASFKHRYVYLTARRKREIVGGCPLFLIDSPWTGRRLVSVPYGVGGGIIADDMEIVDELFKTAGQFAVENQCTSIELRSVRPMVRGMPAKERYVSFERELPRGVDDIAGWLPRKARAAARNARDKYNLTVSFGDEYLREVWRLYCANMRRLGSINYPYQFFLALMDRTPGAHWVSLIRWKGRPVSGLVTFLFRDRVMPYFYGATRDARRCSAANFTYFSLMERAVAEGYRVFDFGRSRTDNAGSADFKRFHGFEPRPLGYQTWMAPGERLRDLSPGNRFLRPLRAAWTWMPSAVTRRLGSFLSHHLPG
jgi:FemAB-related protein (PEP-CTERM system-associated)